jgi:hypothetical protein
MNMNEPTVTVSDSETTIPHANFRIVVRNKNITGYDNGGNECVVGYKRIDVLQQKHTAKGKLVWVDVPRLHNEETFE